MNIDGSEAKRNCIYLQGREDIDCIAIGIGKDRDVLVRSLEKAFFYDV